MSVPSKVHAIQLLKIRPKERLATTSEMNLTHSSVTRNNFDREVLLRSRMSEDLKPSAVRRLTVGSERGWL